jgi:hypothetical protein
MKSPGTYIFAVKFPAFAAWFLIVLGLGSLIREIIFPFRPISRNQQPDAYTIVQAERAMQAHTSNPQSSGGNDG